MRELRSHTSVYDRARSSAWEGPYRAPTDSRAASIILAVVIGVGLAMVVFYSV
jgi:hypothetical protein